MHVVTVGKRRRLIKHLNRIVGSSSRCSARIQIVREKYIQARSGVAEAIGTFVGYKSTRDTLLPLPRQRCGKDGCGTGADYASRHSVLKCAAIQRCCDARGRIANASCGFRTCTRICTGEDIACKDGCGRTIWISRIPDAVMCIRQLPKRAIYGESLLLERPQVKHSV